MRKPALEANCNSVGLHAHGHAVPAQFVKQLLWGVARLLLEQPCTPGKTIFGTPAERLQPAGQPYEKDLSSTRDDHNGGPGWHGVAVDVTLAGRAAARAPIRKKHKRINKINGMPHMDFIRKKSPGLGRAPTAEVPTIRALGLNATIMTYVSI